MIATSDVSKEYGARSLFAEVSLRLNPACRYGLVGANGSGKSTFLRLLAGDEETSGGTVVIANRARIGVLRQDRFLDDGAIILDLAMRGDTVVWNALQEQRRMVEEGAADPGRLADLEDVIASHDGYTLKARASAVLEGLGIPTLAHGRPLSTLSGGFKLRVLLAQVLVGGVDVLLLDEPTNHLDILTIRWLEKFLASYAGCAVIISHDQRFLDNVTSHTLDVDYGTISLYTGNYSAAMVAKESTRVRQETAIARAEEEIARKRSFVERFGAKATKASQAQSRVKQIERLEDQLEDLATTSRRAPLLQFTQERPSGRHVLQLTDISKSYAEKSVLSSVGVKVQRGERVAIIGANGLGKSTLLKIAAQRLRPDSGLVEWGHEVRVGYFPQDHREILDDDETTPLDIIWKACPGETVSYVRGQLGRVLFSGEETEKKIRLLSGGESARLIFSLLAVEKPNVLLLDEPTNHLDIEATRALVDALKSYAGTVIFVSHDRYFVSELATHIIELTPTGLNDFPGTYADYLSHCGDDHLDADAVLASAKQARKEATSGEQKSEAGASWEEKKRRRNRLAQLPKQRDRILADIEAAEQRRQAIQDLYCSEGFFERTSKAEVDALQTEQADLGPRIEAMIAEWEALETELASLQREIADGDDSSG